MRRREFIAGLGTAAAWTLAARAQQGDRVRRIGWLFFAAENDLGSRTSIAALREALAKIGWIEGRNLQIDRRFGAGDLSRIRIYAAELVGLTPEVILTTSGAATRAVQQQTQTIPIVFTAAGDPVVSGVVRSLARPEGNTTGFSVFEPTIGGKWLELLKETMPRLSRVALIFDPELLAFLQSSYISSIEAAARAFAVQTVTMPVRTPAEIARSLDAFAAEPNGGLIVLPPPPTTAFRATIIRLAEQYRLPAMYPSQDDTAAGGLLTYTPDRVDASRRAAAYVDRLLGGAKVSELPVQFATKFELVVNLKTANALGLAVPPSILLRADEVIE